MNDKPDAKEIEALLAVQLSDQKAKLDAMAGKPGPSLGQVLNIAALLLLACSLAVNSRYSYFVAIAGVTALIAVLFWRIGSLERRVNALTKLRLKD